MLKTRRLTKNPAWVAYERKVRTAFRAWDRSTAYWCAKRGDPYDDAAQRSAYARYVQVAHDCPVTED